MIMKVRAVIVMMMMMTEVVNKLSRPLHFQQQFGNIAI
jgi:hypothetical protein